jgi:defect-in-organelle-trafficking protein DotB
MSVDQQPVPNPAPPIPSAVAPEEVKEGHLKDYFKPNEGQNPDETWPDEPNRFQEKDVDALLLWSVARKTSDISIQTDRPIYNDIAGSLRPATLRSIDGADMAIFLTKIYGADAMARLASGIDLDLSYEVRPDRATRVRFRVNITPILSRGRDAVQITMRVLPDVPPKMVDLKVDQAIIDNWAPRDGIVLITGPTGSGKSTLLAAGMRMLIEREDGCGKMLTYEAPIEFVYDLVGSNKSLVSQSEIPRHLKNFEAGVRNALRRKPNIILVGESRDRETISAVIEAGQTGHAVYSTAHTVGVAATIRRMVAAFEAGERTERAYALMETMRMIVTQILVPKIGGGRQALREYLVFTDEIREKFLNISFENWPVELIKTVREHGKPLVKDAKEYYEAGIIAAKFYNLIARGTGEDQASEL